MMIGGQEYSVTTKVIDARGRITFSPDVLNSAGAVPGDIVEVFFRVKKVE
jgi:hypothetical protein